MESFKKPESSEEENVNALSELTASLSELIKTSIVVKFLDGTHEVDNDYFSLSFTLTDNIFEIRNIDTHGNSGIGGDIIKNIHDFADNNNYEVIASNVVDTAHGFWEKMGYQEGGNEGEFFRIE